MAEFAYNNSYQETIKKTPFYANYGINPEHQLITHMMTEKIRSATGMKELHDALQAEIPTAQLRHKEKYDRHRKPDLNLKSGDMVWLLPSKIHITRPSKKLDWKRIWPFKITAKIGSNAYKLDLPPSMRIYNRFHISLLEPYEDTKFLSQIQETTPPIEIEEEDKYELYEIMILDSTTTNSNTEPHGPIILLNRTKACTLLATWNVKPTLSSDFITVILRHHDGVITIAREANSGLPTQEEVKKEEEEWKASIEKAKKTENNHAGMSWIDCHDDECLVHMSEEECSG